MLTPGSNGTVMDAPNPPTDEDEDKVGESVCVSAGKDSDCGFTVMSASTPRPLTFNHAVTTAGELSSNVLAPTTCVNAPLLTAEGMTSLRAAARSSGEEDADEEDEEVPDFLPLLGMLSDHVDVLNGSTQPMMGTTVLPRPGKGDGEVTVRGVEDREDNGGECVDES